MNTLFDGIPASSGFAIGKVLVYKETAIVVNNTLLETATDIETQLALFRKALLDSKEQVQAIKQKAMKALGKKNAAILDAHLEILDDPMLIEKMEHRVRVERKNAELALHEIQGELVALFEAMEADYFRERAADVKDICLRVMKNIKGIKDTALDNLTEQAIVIAEDLTPSDTAAMDLENVLGFVTDLGGRTSHTAIMARSLEIPAVVGAGNLSTVAQNGMTVIVDAETGKVILEPDAETVREYEEKREQYRQNRLKLEGLRELPAVTTDGKSVEMCTNIGSVKDVASALKNGCEGVGLYRTEFLYMDNTAFPSEVEQFEAYKAVAEAMGDQPVIIRTLDIGGDKSLPYYKFPYELNPFLGWRAVRMCLNEKEIFTTQLRAILRASHYGNIKIMFPMIVSLEEIRLCKTILESCKDELRSENIAFNESIDVGIMVETPASVILADFFAREIDFFSIGTNDLTQYMLAVDRGNEKISHMYNPYHPAVLKGIKTVIDASHRAGKWTGMCGEFAGDPKASYLLLGMGLDEFSMAASSIPAVKRIIRKSSFEKAREFADSVLELGTVLDVEKAVFDRFEEMEREPS